MTGWYVTAPRFGAPAKVAHYFSHHGAGRVPLCVPAGAVDPGGTVLLTADHEAPRCVACMGAMRDGCEPGRQP